MQADACREQADESGDGAYAVVRQVPERRASDWPTALRLWRDAVAGLVEFDDLFPA